MQLAKRLLVEYHHFSSCRPEMRSLLFANTIYASVLPVIEIFVAAYIMHNSSDVKKVMVCQLSIYVATPLAFLVNGFLLKRIQASQLYATGMILSGCALFTLMTSSIKNTADVVFFGGLIGLSTGVFWANRGFLVLSVTTDENRDYFYGVELSVATMSSLLVPLVVGLLVSKGGTTAKDNHSYQAIALGSLLLTSISAAVLLLTIVDRAPEKASFSLPSHLLWRKMLVLAALKGLGQGYIVTLPAVLVMQLVGQEDALGILETFGSTIVAASLYLVSRAIRTRHRSVVFTFALLLFFSGSIVNAMLSSVLGVVILISCMLVSKPFIELAYYPIQFLVTDVVSRAECRGRYGYLFTHECGTFVGRSLGCILFLALAYYSSSRAAMLYALPVVAGLQLLSVPIARLLLMEASHLHFQQPISTVHQ